MAIGYKNLILIDNSRSVGEPNFMLCKETAKYICENIGTEDLCRIAVFGEDVEYLTDYTNDAAVLTSCIDEIEMCDRDTYVTDNLVKVITEWEEQDVACRNIILFSDGQEEEPVLHANEELYYMLSEAGYPVYVVQGVESRSISASKNLSAISRISGGKLLLTEFEGSEGGSEKIMGDKILQAIEDERTAAMQSGSDGAVLQETAAESVKDTETAEDNTEEEQVGGYEDMYIPSDHDDEVESGIASKTEQAYITKEAYSGVDNSPLIRNTGKKADGIGLNVIIPAAGLLFAVIFAVAVILITRRNVRSARRDRRVLAGISYDLEREARIAEDAEDYDCSTYKLNEDYGATRLLEQNDGGYDITLEDCSDPTRLYRASCDDSLIVGRAQGLCDIVIDRDDSVSGRHCELSVRNGCWYVRDLQSSNGTKVNNQKVFQELLLKTGDILQLGQSVLQVSI